MVPYTETFFLKLTQPIVPHNVVQILEDESFKPLQDLVEELLEKSDQNKQRGAAELMAGLLCGMVLPVLLGFHRL